MKNRTIQGTLRQEKIENMHPEVLDVDGAARVLGVSRWLVIKKARAKELPAKKVGREWRFRLTTLLRWLGDSTEDADVRGILKALNNGKARLGRT